jgi:hypothetical protein
MTRSTAGKKDSRDERMRRGGLSSTMGGDALVQTKAKVSSVLEGNIKRLDTS